MNTFNNDKNNLIKLIVFHQVQIKRLSIWSKKPGRRIYFMCYFFCYFIFFHIKIWATFFFILTMSGKRKYLLEHDLMYKYTINVYGTFSKYLSSTGWRWVINSMIWKTKNKISQKYSNNLLTSTIDFS